MLNRNMLMVPLLFLLCACAQLGLQPAESFNDRVGYAFATQTAVLSAATSALNAGDISSADAKTVMSISNNAKALIDSARVVHAAGDTKAADKKLTMAVSVLTELQNYLRNRK